MDESNDQSSIGQRRIKTVYGSPRENNRNNSCYFQISLVKRENNRKFSCYSSFLTICKRFRVIITGFIPANPSLLEQKSKLTGENTSITLCHYLLCFLRFSFGWIFLILLGVNKMYLTTMAIGSTYPIVASTIATPFENPKGVISP